MGAIPGIGGLLGKPGLSGILAIEQAIASTDPTGGTYNSHDFVIPAMAAGDLELLIVSTNTATRRLTSVPGFTLLDSCAAVNDGNETREDEVTVWGRVSPSAQAQRTVTGTSISTTTLCAAIAMRISGWSGSLDDIELSLRAGATNQVVDPPPLSPSWGADADTLWIIGANYLYGAGSPVWPADYALARTSSLTLSSSASGTAIFSAGRVLKTASLDPPTFSLSTPNYRQVEFTIAIKQG